MPATPKLKPDLALVRAELEELAAKAWSKRRTPRPADAARPTDAPRPAQETP
jgi:hypothetical protein